MNGKSILFNWLCTAIILAFTLVHMHNGQTEEYPNDGLYLMISFNLSAIFTLAWALRKAHNGSKTPK